MIFLPIALNLCSVTKVKNHTISNIYHTNAHFWESIAIKFAPFFFKNIKSVTQIRMSWPVDNSSYLCPYGTIVHIFIFYIFCLISMLNFTMVLTSIKFLTTNSLNETIDGITTAIPCSIVPMQTHVTIVLWLRSFSNWYC